MKSLLDAVERKRVTDSPYSNAEAYAKLNHPGLAAELRPFITDGRAKRHHPPPRTSYRRKMQAHGTATRASAGGA